MSGILVFDGTVCVRRDVVLSSLVDVSGAYEWLAFSGVPAAFAVRVRSRDAGGFVTNIQVLSIDDGEFFLNKTIYELCMSSVECDLESHTGLVRLP